MSTVRYWKWLNGPVEIVDFPMKNKVDSSSSLCGSLPGRVSQVEYREWLWCKMAFGSKTSEKWNGETMVKISPLFVEVKSWCNVTSIVSCHITKVKKRWNIFFFTGCNLRKTLVTYIISTEWTLELHFQVERTGKLLPSGTQGLENLPLLVLPARNLYDSFGDCTVPCDWWRVNQWEIRQLECSLM